MRHDHVGRVLEREVVLVLKVSGRSGLQEPMGFAKRALQALRRERLVGIDHLVDLRDHRREGAQPRKVLVVQQEVEELARGDGPMALLVRAALTVQENSVEPQQSAAEITQTVAILVHDLSCLSGIHHAPTITARGTELGWGTL
jgi:hypothetical protein